MWPHRVVVASPAFDKHLGLQQRVEMNNDGRVVGRGNLTGTGKSSLATTLATIYDSQSATKSLLTDTVASDARAINDVGQTAGIAYYPAKGNQADGADAFYYDPTAGFWAMDDLIVDVPEDTTYWHTRYIADYYFGFQAVSDPLANGYPLIVGSRRLPSSLFEDGVERQWGFILTPSAISGSSAATAIPEPAALVLACLGMLMLISHRRFESS